MTHEMQLFSGTLRENPQFVKTDATDERGRIIETGSHDALLDEQGLYYAMWRQQIGER